MLISPWNLFAYTAALGYAASFAPRKIRIGALILAIPAGYPVAWALTGMLGGLSYTTGLLFAMETLRRIAPDRIRLAPAMAPASALALLLAGLTIYAASTGPLRLDVYHGPGATHHALIAAFVALAAIPSIRPWRSFAIITPPALLLSPSGLHDSHNAWDHFIDPVILLMAATVLIRSLITRIRPESAGSVA